jgi:hypothetical protein
MTPSLSGYAAAAAAAAAGLAAAAAAAWEVMGTAAAAAVEVADLQKAAAAAAAASLHAADLRQRQLLFGCLPPICPPYLHLPLSLSLLLPLLAFAAGGLALAPAPAAHSSISNTIVCGSLDMKQPCCTCVVPISLPLALVTWQGNLQEHRVCL